ncbi:heterokaryon incompatibility protein-domain-containing protein [Leptodontidium sp. MPI-SDFR-AT-0119]|nr:heterokaryon incompatibility protein-domain-containing protein [Leptodontidium sp. MPI-SDFR-AT-0119]
MLCTKCKSVSFESANGHGYLHHNLRELELSANQGCHFCIMLLHGLCFNYVSKTNGLTGKNKERDSTWLDQHRSDPRRIKLWITDKIGTPQNSGHLRIKGVWAERSVSLMVMDLDDEFLRFSSPDEADTSTGSNNSMGLVKTWVKNCTEHHSGKRCRAADPTYLPTRVLDLEIFCDDTEPCVKLCVPQQPEKALYMALSHCWGNVQSITTTTGNLSNHQTSIQKKLLSKTFREAIDITLQLGIRYLWIDSLCIIQDSLEDWTSESARMSEVYSNAFATVFEVKASDGSQGCFANRNAMMNHPCKLGLRFSNGRPVYAAPATGSSAGASGPLYGRAWVYQEELLSRRSIAFAANGV